MRWRLCEKRVAKRTPKGGHRRGSRASKARDAVMPRQLRTLSPAARVDFRGSSTVAMDTRSPPVAIPTKRPTQWAVGRYPAEEKGRRMRRRDSPDRRKPGVSFVEQLEVESARVPELTQLLARIEQALPVRRSSLPSGERRRRRWGSSSGLGRTRVTSDAENEGDRYAHQNPTASGRSGKSPRWKRA